MPGGWQHSTRASQLPPGWPRLRNSILKRDQRICYLCHGPGADAVDHIVRGNNHDPSNLAAVHDRTPPHCHREKTTREGAAALPRERRTPEPHPGLT